MGYRRTKNFIITPKGVRISKKEYDYFIKQTRSVNYGLKKLRDLTAPLEKETYLKYPQTVYNIPKNLSQSLKKFSSLEEFREQVYKNEVLRLQVLKKPRSIEEMNMSFFTKKMVRKARRYWKKNLRMMKFMNRRLFQYRENIIKAIKNVFGGTDMSDRLVEELLDMTESQFNRFISITPFEIINYIGSADVRLPVSLLEQHYKDLMNYISKVKA